jgi:Ras-related protein Rab-18
MLGTSIYPATFLSSWLTVDLCPCLHMRSPTCVMHLVYDMSNREPFEALRDRPEELENHVPPEVVKIVVGNKLYKVKSSPLLSLSSSFPPTFNARHSRLRASQRTRSWNTLDKCPPSEGVAFAARTGCLFAEASAKTAVGVTEAFDDVVARIIDTPSLWNEDMPKSLGRTAASANTTAVSGPRRDTAESMPGSIDLSQVQDEDT